MTVTSDQKPDSEGLSAHSRQLHALRETVLTEWERRLRATLEQARALDHPLLINTLPVFYDNIAQALTPDYPRTTGSDGTTLASEHGGERARLTGYDHQALIMEYQLFRSVIFDLLDGEGIALSAREVATINTSIDAAIMEAVHGFVLVQNRLREQFSAALAHDLRGPLGVTSAALELMLMTNDPAKMKPLAARALDNVHRMDRMIHELLDTMSFHSGARLALELSHFDIGEVLREVRLGTAGTAEAETDLQLTGAEVHGWWDRSAMKRVVENLVSNARKYGQAGGTVTIRAEERHGRMVLSVHNEGLAIPLEEQEAIFRMYRRAHSANAAQDQGWGIGLPYVRAVAESHGGSIGLDSTAERGTTFMVDVPVDCRPFVGAPTAT